MALTAEREKPAELEGVSVSQVFAAARRHRWVLLLTLAVTVAATLVVGLMLPKQYESTATLRVGTAVSGSFNSIDYEVQYTERLMNTYVQIAESERVMRELMVPFGLDSPPSVQAEVVPNTELLRLTARSDSASGSADLANAWADILIEEADTFTADSAAAASAALAQELEEAAEALDAATDEYRRTLVIYGSDSPLAAVAESKLALAQTTYIDLRRQAGAREALLETPLKVVDAGQAPDGPTSPGLVVQLGLGVIVGLILGVIAALIVDWRGARKATAG